MTQQELSKTIRSLCKEIEANKEKGQPFEYYIANREGIENEIVNGINQHVAEVIGENAKLEVYREWYFRSYPDLPTEFKELLVSSIVAMNNGIKAEQRERAGLK